MKRRGTNTLEDPHPHTRTSNRDIRCIIQMREEKGGEGEGDRWRRRDMHTWRPTPTRAQRTHAREQETFVVSYNERREKEGEKREIDEEGERHTCLKTSLSSPTHCARAITNARATHESRLRARAVVVPSSLHHKGERGERIFGPCPLLLPLLSFPCILPLHQERKDQSLLSSPSPLCHPPFPSIWEVIYSSPSSSLLGFPSLSPSMYSLFPIPIAIQDGLILLRYFYEM